jgi:large subunit ribosomal protein L25
VPAVVHDHGKDSWHVSGDYIKFVKMYERAGKHHPLELHLGSKKQLAIIKDVDYEPVKHRMRHVVFQAIKQDEKVEAEIPVIIEGEVPAEKAGFMVITHLNQVKVEALPKDLPDQLVAQADKLAEIGDKLAVEDLKVPSGVTVLEEPDAPLATVEETKAQVSEEAETAEGEGEEGAESEGAVDESGGTAGGGEGQATNESKDSKEE